MTHPGRGSRWTLVVSLCALVAAPALAHSIRGHRVGSSSRAAHRVGHSGFHASYFYVAPYYPYASFGYGPAWYPWWGPAYPAYGGAYAGFAYADTDVSPEDAEVYLDGEYVGLADDYDGFPSYLPLEPGRHTLTFRLEGHRSVTRTVKIPRGAVLDLRFSLPKGREGGPGEEEGSADIVVPEPPAAPPEAREEEPEGEGEPALLDLRVSPPGASIYLDGEFYGTGRTLAALHGPLRTDAGRRRIQVVMPGYAPASREVDLTPGEVTRLSIELRLDGGR